MHKIKEILVATSNKNKLAELKSVAKRFDLVLLAPEEVAKILKLPLDSIPSVEEDADSFRGNALLKAEAFAKWSGLPTLGDDSGLEVEALNGAPGIHSARYAGHGASDEQKINKLLLELNKVLKENPERDRKARFFCYLVLKFPNGKLLESEGELTGEILEAPRGIHGFGYDPIVNIHEFGKTLAEIDFSLTCAKGFRAKAAEKLFMLLNPV